MYPVRAISDSDTFCSVSGSDVALPLGDRFGSKRDFCNARLRRVKRDANIGGELGQGKFCRGSGFGCKHRRLMTRLVSTLSNMCLNVSMAIERRGTTCLGS